MRSTLLVLRRTARCGTSIYPLEIRTRFYSGSPLRSLVISNASTARNSRSEWYRLPSYRCLSSKEIIDDQSSNRQEGKKENERIIDLNTYEQKSEDTSTTAADGHAEEKQQQQTIDTVGQDAIDKSLFTEPIKIRMPDMGEGDGKILQWYKKEGELIRRDEALCLIETEDFSFDMITEDESDAVVGEILVPEGSSARDEQVICILLHPKADPKAAASNTKIASETKPVEDPPAENK